MSVLDVDQLLVPVSSDSPCGENLEYDADYAAMEQAAAGKPDQQFGNTTIPGEEPNWVEVRSKATDLMGRTKDLRVGTYLVRGLAWTAGLEGLADGLAVLNGLLEKYWDGVHPQLDPEDGNDPTLRVNTIAGLTDPSAMLRAVQGAPLIAPRGMRKITFKDVQIAAGELPQPSGAEKIEQSTIDGAFSECNPDELLKAGKVAKQALDGVRQLEATIGEKVGVANGPELEPLLDILKPISKLLDQKITARGLDSEEETSAPTASASAAADERAEGNGEAGSAAANGRKAGAVVNVTGDITSREDVIRALDRICDYYKRYEPSSPVPLFLNRAKRLASKSFLEILRDLTPDAVNQALALSGITEGAAVGATVDANDI